MSFEESSISKNRQFGNDCIWKDKETLLCDHPKKKVIRCKPGICPLIKEMAQIIEMIGD